MEAQADFSGREAPDLEMAFSSCYACLTEKPDGD
jgi:hypothetical protein